MGGRVDLGFQLKEVLETYCIHNQKAEDDGVPAIRVLLCVPAQIQVQGMVLPTLRVGLATSITLIQIIPYKHGQRHVSWVIPDSVMLATESNYPT